MRIDKEMLANMPLPPLEQGEAKEDQTAVLAVGFIVSPLNIEGPMKIQLRAYIDNEEIKGNA